MKATSTLTRKTALEILIESRDKSIINALIAKKEIALEEAVNNAEWYASLGLDGMADNEVARQEKTNKRYRAIESSYLILIHSPLGLHNTIHDNETKKKRINCPFKGDAARGNNDLPSF